MKLDITNVTVCSASRYGKVSWFEANVIAFDENHKIVRFTVDLPFSELREMGVTKSMNGWNKVRQWVWTEAGQEYLLKNRSRKSIFASIKDGDISA